MEMQQNVELSGGPSLVLLIIYLAVIVIGIAGLWATFAKAGKPGWAAIVPIYNFIVVYEIAGKPIWWILLWFIPCVNIIFWCITLMALAERFGKNPGFGIGLALLGFVFFPILGFGDAKYTPAPPTAK